MSQPRTAPKPSVDSTNDRLKSFVERIERLESEKKEIAYDIKDVYLESKATGFEPKIIREVIRLRKMAADDRQEHESLLDTYCRALGMS